MRGASTPQACAADLLAWLESCCDRDGLLSAPPAASGPQLTWPHQGQYYVQTDAGGAFIHPDAAAFLSARLDDFIKTRLLALDGSLNVDQLRRHLACSAQFRAAARPLIDAIAAAEEHRRQQWLAESRILETHYGITLDRIPRAFYADIAANDAQRAEWLRLYGTDQIEADPFLMLDTRFFDAAFTARLLAALPDLDAALDGLLIHADNFHALRLLAEKGVGSLLSAAPSGPFGQKAPDPFFGIDCIYTDPPYNTGGMDLSYPDRYAPAHWLTLMDNRLRLAHTLLKPGGSCFISIDENQQAQLELLLADIFAPGDFVTTFVWETGRKNDSKLVSVSHEYMLCYVKGLAGPARKALSWRVRKEGIDEIHARARLLVRRCHGDYAKASLRLRQWLNGLPDNHPARRHKHYHCVDARGVYHPSNISWPGGGGPRYEVLHPVTQRPCKIPSRGWMYPTPQRMAEAIRDDLVHFGPDENRVPCAKVYLIANEHQAPASVFYRDGRAAMKRLRHILGSDCFCNPKDERLIAERIRFSAPADATVLDFFAGSGSTAHAVLHLNRLDGGQRRYILIEMGPAFDAILRPRLQRVVYASKWKHGRPETRDGLSHAFKVLRLQTQTADPTPSVGSAVDSFQPDLANPVLLEFLKQLRAGHVP